MSEIIDCRSNASLIGRHSAASTGPILNKLEDKLPCQQRLSVLVFGATPIFLLRDIGSFTIFTILRTIFATEPALLNRLCFIGYLCSVFHIIDAYSAKIDMSMLALWGEFDAFCRSYVTLVRSSTFSDMVFERLWLPCQRR